MGSVGPLGWWQEWHVTHPDDKVMFAYVPMIDLAVWSVRDEVEEGGGRQKEGEPSEGARTKKQPKLQLKDMESGCGGKRREEARAEVPGTHRGHKCADILEGSEYPSLTLLFSCCLFGPSSVRPWPHESGRPPGRREVAVRTMREHSRPPAGRLPASAVATLCKRGFC